MEYTTLTTEGSDVQALSQEQTHSLYEICKQIEDKRAARGKHYELAGLLMVLIMAKLAGMKSLLGASDWVRDQEKRLRACLELSWKRMPCATTYKYALSRLDSQQINEQIRDWLGRQAAESHRGAQPMRFTRQAHQPS